jgi:hypothetical protein
MGNQAIDEPEGIVAEHVICGAKFDYDLVGRIAGIEVPPDGAGKPRKTEVETSIEIECNNLAVEIFGNAGWNCS